jgi:ferredoxin
MIVAQRKPLEEILGYVGNARRIAVAGCGTCVAVCWAGGEKEVELLATELRMALDLKEDTQVECIETTVQRQCDPEFIEPLAEDFAGADLVISMACGAGVQFVARRFPEMVVVPALDTTCIGVTVEPGYWTEYCQACGQCVLSRTGGICPVTRCSKGILNGPCGGSVDGQCEINPEVECAWQLIYDRLKGQGRLDLLDEVVGPCDWQASHAGGPRTVRREEPGS